MPASVRRKNAREVVAAALAAGRTCADAAAAGGVNERTTRRWLEDEQFAKQVEALRAEIVGEALAVLSAGMTGAATELRELVRHADPHVRFKAAKTVIELGLKFRELAELQAQVEAMDRQITELMGATK